MSRIGIKNIEVPSGVNVTINGLSVAVKGAKSELSQTFDESMTIKMDGQIITVERSDDSNRVKALHGLTRQLISNMIDGVTKGFEKKLEIIGVGYKADMKGDVVHLNLGYSHPIDYKLPKGITAKVDKQTEITITGSDKQLVGQVAADIRDFRKPEPYKGKGIKYSDEHVRRKAGKAGK